MQSALSYERSDICQDHQRYKCLQLTFSENSKAGIVRAKVSGEKMPQAKRVRIDRIKLSLGTYLYTLGSELY